MQMIATYLPYIQLVLAVLLTALILLQNSEGALGSAFGGDNFNTQFRTRRGAELFIFRLTIVVAVVFVLSAIANLVL
jgi:protein translocase SecG subunit